VGIAEQDAEAVGREVREEVTEGEAVVDRDATNAGREFETKGDPLLVVENE